MRISFNFNRAALTRTRNLDLQLRRTGRYAIPNTSEYLPLYQYVTSTGSAYPFRLQDALHATAIMMLRRPMTRSQSLFATGGLYLALDIAHPNLAMSQTFGDFSSGFSHQFGVAFAVMSMSEAFGVPWDRLVPIPVRGRRELDYQASIPDSSNWLRLEAKGVTSESGQSAAVRSAYTKKLVDPDDISSRRRDYSNPTAMVGVITKAARRVGEDGSMEVVDPELDIDEERRLESNQSAGMYLHYAGLARFAGLHRLSDEFVARADVLLEKGHQLRRISRLNFADNTVADVGNHQVVGVQWRVGDGEETDGDVWFYHGMDVLRLRAIAVQNEFPPCAPYKSMMNSNLVSRGNYSESFMPDGSYFGIGGGQRKGLLTVDRRKTFINELAIEIIE